MDHKNLISNIWRKNALVWSGYTDTIQQRLGWLDCVSEFETRAETIQAFAKSIPYSHVVLLGMGGSSLVSKVFSHCLSHKKRTFHVLDTTDPVSIRSIQDQIPLKDTLFVVASKSGTTIEADCLLDYFFEICPHPEQFIAITDFNTPLMRKAEKLRFRHVFVNPSDIGGRFAVFSYFGLVPLALMGADLKNFLACAKDVIRQCQTAEDNPALELALFLFENYKNERNKLTFLSTPSISTLPFWIEQLIAESTGKHGKGILPVLDDPTTFQDWNATDRTWIIYQTSNEQLSFASKLQNQPFMVRIIEKFDDLAKEFFIWKFATALLGAMLEINPFDEPDVVKSKENTVSFLTHPQSISQSIHNVSTTPDKTDSFLSGIRAPEFIAILSYTSETIPFAKKIKSDFSKYHVATTVSFGPSYLHSTGQFHKGGPNLGRYIIVVDDQPELPIPNREYGFQTLKLSQALGDYQALTQADRKVLMVKI